MIHDDSQVHETGKIGPIQEVLSPHSTCGSAEVAMKGHTMVLYRAPVRAESIASAETLVWRPGASPIHKL